MTHDDVTILAAATALAELLECENEALVALAFGRATALAGEKERAIDRFNRAAAAERAGALSAALGHRLGELVAENKRLLERALFVQGQVIACIARAAPRRDAMARSYGRTGAWAGQGASMPIALAARV
jgi:hypothetical protein